MADDLTTGRLDAIREEYAVIAGRLREAREFLGLSQLEVAGALDMNRPAVSDIERGRRKVTGLELRRFARLYRRPVGWLLGEEAEPDAAILAAVRDLADTDREQVLRFAEFLAREHAPKIRINGITATELLERHCA